MTPFFFFNDTATTEISTLSLHDALPIWGPRARRPPPAPPDGGPSPPRRRAPTASPGARGRRPAGPADRKSTRLNSSHANISYAVFCLKKKKRTDSEQRLQHVLNTTDAAA